MCQLLFIGTTELLLIGGMALLLFGGKKLPEMMRGLGQGVREFKKGVNDTAEEAREEEPQTDAPEGSSSKAADSQQHNVIRETVDGLK